MNAGASTLRAFMRGSPWVVVPVLFAAVSVGGRQAPRTGSRPRDAQLQALVSDAMSAPPEFAADILIRASQSSAITDDRWRRELLEEAFMRAYDAQQDYRRASSPVSPDTRQGAD